MTEEEGVILLEIKNKFYGDYSELVHETLRSTPEHMRGEIEDVIQTLSNPYSISDKNYSGKQIIMDSEMIELSTEEKDLMIELSTEEKDLMIELDPELSDPFYKLAEHVLSSTPKSILRTEMLIDIAVLKRKYYFARPDNGEIEHE